MKTFIIGIGGVTNSRSTTLAKNLRKHLPNCSKISQDNFFKSEPEADRDENGSFQYEVLEELNMEEKNVSRLVLDGKPKALYKTSSLGNAQGFPFQLQKFSFSLIRSHGDRGYFPTIPYEELRGGHRYATSRPSRVLGWPCAAHVPKTNTRNEHHHLGDCLPR